MRHIEHWSHQSIPMNLILIHTIDLSNKCSLLTYMDQAALALITHMHILCHFYFKFLGPKSCHLETNFTDPSNGHNTFPINHVYTVNTDYTELFICSVTWSTGLPGMAPYQIRA